MPLTTLMTLIGSLVMIGSWAYVGERLKHTNALGNRQVQLLRSFFLFMGLFCLSIFIPNITLSVNPHAFPLSMAWGYTIGHAFLYIGLIQVLRLTCTMVPRLARFETVAIASGLVLAAAITALTISTMVFGTHPVYDAEKHITLFNVASSVGALIGLFATISVLPAATLMLIIGYRNPYARTRSYLLGGGLFIIMTAGPLHDVSRSWQLYMVADVVSIVGLLITAAGVAYRISERISTPGLSAAPTR